MSGYFTKMQALNHINPLTYCFFKLPNWHTACLVLNKYLFLALLNTFQPRWKGIKRKTQMKNKFLKSLVASFALIISGFANAGLITSSSGITSAYPDYELITFEELTFANGTNITNQFSPYGVNISPELDYLATISRTNGSGAGLYNYAGTPYTTPFSFDFTSTVEAMGFYIVMNTGQNVTFEALLNGSVVESYNETWSDCCAALSFRGFSGGIYDSMRVTMVSGGNNAMELDNLYFATTTEVPEPSTLVVFALGLMGLASRKFKKQD